MSEHKSVKKTMMLRVLLTCTLLLGAVVLFFLYGPHKEKIDYNVIGFFAKRTYLLFYLGVVNIITFILFGIDKWSAIKHKRRIPIVTLLGMCFVGGSMGGLLGMYLLHHKTKKNYFYIGVPLIIVTQIGVLFCAMNVKL